MARPNDQTHHRQDNDLENLMPSTNQPVHLSRCVLLACSALVVLVLAGCGDSDDSFGSFSDANCNLSMPLTGAVSETLSMGINEGCGGSRSSLTWGVLNTTYRVNVSIDGAMRGEVGTGLATVVTITRTADNQVWTTPANGCTVDLTRNELESSGFGPDSFNLGGTGSCTLPAVNPTDATNTISVGNFTFANSTAWSQ